jgi:hypothetical protein
MELEHDDEVLICAHPYDVSIHEPIPPTQEEEDEVSHFLFKILIIPCFMIQRRMKKGNL